MRLQLLAHGCLTLRHWTPIIQTASRAIAPRTTPKCALAIPPVVLPLPPGCGNTLPAISPSYLLRRC